MIVYGSRGSDLALTQTRWVAERVKAATGEDYRVEVMVTTGDRIQDRPLSGIGVKGLFTKELEDALHAARVVAGVLGEVHESHARGERRAHRREPGEHLALP